jgi:ubiquinone/menaquinone biosynthesis C-methylase UbiE
MYQGRLAELSVSNASLEARLDVNQRFSSRDFHKWVLGHLAIRQGMDVLDVGCGNGAQSLAMLERVGETGSVSALDISEQSVLRLRGAAGDTERLQTVACDMMETANAIRNVFRHKIYDLAQSTYALYYAADPLTVLDSMRTSLKPGGRLAVCTPNDPHSLSLLCGRFLELPAEVVACGKFGPDVLEPYFRTYFDEIDIHLLRNEMRFTKVEDVLVLLRNAAYFEQAIEAHIAAEVTGEISKQGYFRSEKNSYLIVGRLD